MIYKTFELKKIPDNKIFYLLYGKNEGLKKEALNVIIEDKSKTLSYEEKEILENENNFIENILSKSLFETQKFIIIKRATDKILRIIEILHQKNLEDTLIILNSDNLDKKSKLRSLFEKDKKLVCVPFYPDNDQTISKLAYNFLKDKKISISPSNINLIVNRCSGDRETLVNELQKIEYFSKNGKKISRESISKLINLNENHSISELIDNCLAKNKKKTISILNENNFIENILSKSLFETQKFIIIKRATDKILRIIEILHQKNLEDTLIILNSDNLDKKSKLRSFFEKEKKLVCVPFYPDNDQTLSKLAYIFLRDKKISISPSNINLIVNKCSGDRETLVNELQKIEYFTKNGKKINSESISKLINLNENNSISELIDNCLAKNKKKIISILNENNFNNEDCIMITRTFIIKAKKLLTLSKTFETNKNIDLTISSAKPPIFWKEKEITKQQIYKWKSKNIKQLIYALSEIELQIKKNINNSINLITDFILSHSSAETSN